MYFVNNTKLNNKNKKKHLKENRIRKPTFKNLKKKIIIKQKIYLTTKKIPKTV